MNNSSDRNPINAVYELINVEQRDIISIVIYAIGIGLFSLVIPIGVQVIVNNISFATFNQPIIFMLLAILLALSLAGLFKVLQTVIVEKMQTRLFARSAVHLTQHLPKVDFEKMKSYPSGMALSQWTNRFFEILTVQKSVAGLLLDGVSIFLQGFIGLILLAFYHPILLAFDFVLIGSLVIAFFVFGRGLIRTAIDESYEKHHVAAWLEDLADKYILFRTPNGMNLAQRRANTLIDNYLEKRKTHFRRFLRQVIFFVLIQVVASVGLLALGAWLVTRNQLSLGQLVAAELVVSTVLVSILKLEKQLDSFYDLTAALDKLRSLNELPQEKHVTAIDSGTLAPEGPAELEFREVTCVGQDNHRILSAISFKVSKHQHTLLQGPKGSGKSAITNLCFGLSDASSGVILLDKKDLRIIPKSIIRQSVVLLRKAEVLSETVFQNISLGQSSIMLENVTDLLSRFGIYDDILKLPLGLETVLRYDGNPLSHLQIQMIVLARALLMKPRLLIVDRFLDELDEEQLHRCCKEIFKQDAPWTVIVASNRYRLQEYVSQTVLLENGRIVA